MGILVPVIHAIEYGIGLVHHPGRAFSQRIELGIGDDHRNFDDAVGVGAESGHFHVEPDECVLILSHKPAPFLFFFYVKTLFCHSSRALIQMTTKLFVSIFLTAVAASFLLHVYLLLRQIGHVKTHRATVPSGFSDRITLVDHQKAADYTIEKSRLALLELVFSTVLLLGLTVGGGVQSVATFCAQFMDQTGYSYGLALVGSVIVISYLVDLPLDLYRTFVLEARYGFNTLTGRLYLADLFRNALLAGLIGAPVLGGILWLMSGMGHLWWFWVWLFWMGFNLLALLLYPTLIAPLFNKFQPLDNPDLKSRIEALLARCGFQSNGLFVMDGSKRSTHGNAYFTGFGQGKRIVFYDTLLERLNPAEIDAVLAHELGHYRYRHVWKRIVLLATLTLLFFFVLGILIDAPWFYEGLGVHFDPAMMSSPGQMSMALLLFFLVVPSFTFLLSPLTSQLSRRHEYEADAYAASQTAAEDLMSALVKLYRDNAATLTPDPLHSLFHDSHPPAALRINHLKRL